MKTAEYLLAEENRTRFRSVMTGLRRYRLLILGCTVLGTACGAGIGLSLTPQYEAEAHLVIEPHRANASALPGIVLDEAVPPDEAMVRSETAVLESDGLIRAVIDRLSLADRPGFHPPSWTDSLWTQNLAPLVKKYAPWLRGSAGSDRIDADPAFAATRRLAQTVAAFKRHLKVTDDSRSYVVTIGFTAEDPVLAANVVNSLTETYLADQVKYKREATESFAQLLSQQITALQDKVRLAEEEAESWREQNHIILNQGGNVLGEQLSRAGSELAQARAELAKTDAEWHESISGNRQTANPDLPPLLSPLYETLKAQEAALTQHRADLLAQFGSMHPQVIKANAELADIRAHLQQELARQTLAAGSAHRVALERVQIAQHHYDDLESQFVTANRAEVHMREIERSAMAGRETLQAFMNRFQELDAQNAMQKPDARLIAAATPPIEPRFPDLVTLIPGSLVLSMLVGIAAAILLELRHTGFASAREIEARAAIPSFGSIPRLAHRPGDEALLAQAVIDAPGSAYAEAVHYVQDAILETPADTPCPQVILITSALSGEGKSILSASLARSLALAGKRTLLIDGDLRRPALARLFRLTGLQIDLGAVLAGEASLQDAICADPCSTLDLLPALPATRSPQRLLAGAEMNALIAACRTAYDVILIDSPPVTAVSDSLILARLADATLLAVRWRQTTREVLQLALSALLNSGMRLTGAVLMDVDLRRGNFMPHQAEYYHGRNAAYFRGIAHRGTP